MRYHNTTGISTTTAPEAERRLDGDRVWMGMQSKTTPSLEWAPWAGQYSQAAVYPRRFAAADGGCTRHASCLPPLRYPPLLRDFAGICPPSMRPRQSTSAGGLIYASALLSPAADPVIVCMACAQWLSGFGLGVQELREILYITEVSMVGAQGLEPWTR